MKVILSRKGFDSENGFRIPSVVMPDGNMVSFPIPAGEDRRYSELKYGERTYSEMISDLLGNQIDAQCHFDPDLDGTRYVKRPKGWKAGFGQCSSSLSYLMDTVGIEPGDLFLFFGWFHFVEIVDGHLRFQRKTGDFYHDKDLHVIWGYMQVGDIVKTQADKEKKLPWHPHSDSRRRYDDHDYIFTATRKLSFAPDMPGAGLLPFAKDRVLTLKGASKANWRENKVYMPENVIGKRKNSAKGAGVYYSGIWQELALRETKDAENWAKKIVLC